MLYKDFNMNQLLCLIISFICCQPLIAGVVVDIYGENKNTSEQILQKYSNKIVKIERYIIDSYGTDQVFDEKKIETLVQKREDLKEQIKKEYHLLYIDFSSTIYPGEKNSFITIEVINHKEPDRLRFVQADVKRESIDVNEKNRKNVIDDMLIYTRLGIPLSLKNLASQTNDACPVFHCFWGFNDKVLKPYLKVFNTGAVHERQLIIDTLNNKKANPERRIAACYLVGHFSDPHDIVTALMPFVYDQDAGVRNAVMRVIGATLEKAKMTQLDVSPFLDVLHSPYTTDRNKALYVLLALANNQDAKHLIIKKGGDTLVALLKLKQPNNHGFAYMLLKKISGKDFGENNINAWRKWVISAKTSVA